MEEIRTDELGSGFYCGRRNQSGAAFRVAGGDQERREADRYRELAGRVRVTSSFVASVLDQFVAAYLQEARRWDLDDEWRR